MSTETKSNKSTIVRTKSSRRVPTEQKNNTTTLEEKNKWDTAVETEHKHLIEKITNDPQFFQKVAKGEIIYITDLKHDIKFKKRNEDEIGNDSTLYFQILLDLNTPTSA